MVSVLIVTWNNLPYTKILYESLLNFTEYHPIEILFIDNGSTDGTVEWLKNIKNKKVRYVFLKENLGLIKAKNIGIRKSKGDYLCFLDNDMRICTDGWLKTMVSWFEKLPKAGAVAPRCNMVSDASRVHAIEGLSRINQWRDRMPMFRAEEDVSFVIEKYLSLMKTNRHYPKPFEKNLMLEGSGTLMKKDVIEKLGPLDEDFGLAWHGSEVWTRKLRRLGYKTYVISDVFLFHYGHATANLEFMLDLMKHHEKSQVHLAEMEKKWRSGKIE